MNHLLPESSWRFKTMNLLHMHRCILHVNGTIFLGSTYRLLKEAIITHVKAICCLKVVGGSKQWIMLQMHNCLACKWFNTSWSTYRLLKAIIAREPFLLLVNVQCLLKHVQIVKRGNNRTWTIYCPKAVGGSKQWICCGCTMVLHVNGSILLEACTDY